MNRIERGSGFSEVIGNVTSKQPDVVVGEGAGVGFSIALTQFACVECLVSSLASSGSAAIASCLNDSISDALSRLVLGEVVSF